MTSPNTLASSIRDNRERGSVGDYLKKHIQTDSQLSVVSAYFTIYAFSHLKEHLKDIKDLRFLFGEPRFLKQIDPDKTDKKSFNLEDDGLSLKNRLQQNRVARECADWIKEKAQIRSIIYPNFLHGKLYHIEKNGVEKAIMGSSNFTVNGLGLGGSRNVELNLVVDSERDKEDLKNWFEDIWDKKDLVEDVKEEVLRYLSEIYADYSPEFIYQKTLYHLFEGVLQEKNEAERQQTQMLLSQTQIWNSLYSFQEVAVQSAIGKIQKHNGCIIADSVGLGKTYEALAVIKYFEVRNQNVLVLCPKKLRENWTIYQSHANNLLNPFPSDRFSFTVLSHTDLSRERGKASNGDIDLANFNWGNYDLVVIDESHNFRNNSKGKRDVDGSIIRQSRYERLMQDIIKSGVKTKVLLLSATPVNTDLKDLRNQIYLLTGDNDKAFRETIGVASVKDTLAQTQRQFTEWAEDTNGNRDRRSLLLKLNPAFFKLLDELTIARSRKHVEQYYEESIGAIGNFPKRFPPKSIYSEIDTKHRFMTYDRLNDEISNYKLSVFNPAKYVKKEYRDKYLTTRVSNFSQEEREHHLIGMMRVNFLKRLESSINSFAITLEKTINKIEDLETKINLFKVNQQMTLFDLETLEVFGDDDELNEAFQIGTKLKYDLRHLDIDKWLKELQEDKQQLDLILSQAKQIDAERDSKLQDLKTLISEKVNNPSTNRKSQSNKKTLVFTAFADTAQYLYRHLESWAKNELGIHIGLVTGTGANQTTFGRTYFNEILTNFSPYAKKRFKIPSMPQDEEIDLLIATDCISEGQNLQDCDLVINYDIHWNPVRIIQRFGRIDRLGSLNESVQLINFWVTDDLNQYLNLKNRVEARMALVDVSTTSSDNILLPNEIERIAKDELNYRDQQLMRLKDEVIDIEDFNESIALNDFSLDDFRAELSDQLESERRKLRDAPFGIYAITSANEENPQGVIFCLQQESVIEKAEKVNPLQPFYLVYVRNEGAVFYSFIQAKQMLETFRALCYGNNKPLDDLCRQFNEETKDGEDMTFYDSLLKQALSEIKRSFQQRNTGNLFAGRGGTLLNFQEDLFESSNFKLITWLVIK